MGLLDDAIREHLELKRRRGADPAEVEQQEREALGPVRGGAAPATDDAVDHDAVDHGADDAFADAPPPPLPEAELDPEPERAPPPPPPPPAPVAHEEPHDEPPFSAPEHHGAVRAPEPPPEPPAPEPREHVSQPTQSYSVDDLDELRRDAEPEDVVPADEEPEAEDVLDETPDFLQEAPEHDRLWFEQRPPRDFDF